MKIMKDLYLEGWSLFYSWMLLLLWIEASTCASIAKLLITNYVVHWTFSMCFWRIIYSLLSNSLSSITRVDAGHGERGWKIMWSGSKYLGLVMKQTPFFFFFFALPWVFWRASFSGLSMAQCMMITLEWRKMKWKRTRSWSQRQDDHPSLSFSSRPSPNRFTAQTHQPTPLSLFLSYILSNTPQPSSKSWSSCPLYQASSFSFL
jgi:hypothetical protein